VVLTVMSRDTFAAALPGAAAPEAAGVLPQAVTAAAQAAAISGVRRYRAPVRTLNMSGFMPIGRVRRPLGSCCSGASVRRVLSGLGRFGRQIRPVECGQGRLAPILLTICPSAVGS
jgi:hypothetical protein